MDLRSDYRLKLPAPRIWRAMIAEAPVGGAPMFGMRRREL